MVDKINTQIKQGVFSLVKRAQVPTGVQILPAVWSLRRKRDMKTSKIKPATTSTDPKQSKESTMMSHMHHQASFAMVYSLRKATKQINYVLAYPKHPTRGSFYPNPQKYRVLRIRQEGTCTEVTSNHLRRCWRRTELEPMRPICNKPKGNTKERNNFRIKRKSRHRSICLHQVYQQTNQLHVHFRLVSSGQRGQKNGFAIFPVAIEPQMLTWWWAQQSTAK